MPEKGARVMSIPARWVTSKDVAVAVDRLYVSYTTPSTVCGWRRWLVEFGKQHRVETITLSIFSQPRSSFSWPRFVMEDNHRTSNVPMEYREGVRDGGGCRSTVTDW